MVDFADQYLRILGTGRRQPDHAHLCELVQAQLNRFPYENISKLLDSDRGVCALPPPERYLKDNEDYGFGGTCYAQNGYFRELLKALGYDTELVFTSVDGVSRDHINCRVFLDGTSYIVDFGFMNGFSGPFDENGPAVRRRMGGRDFSFTPLGERKFRIEIHKDGVTQPRLESEEGIHALEQLRDPIIRSFSPDALFMKHFVLARRWGHPSYTVFKGDFFVARGEEVEKRRIADLDDLERIVHREMGFPRYPVRQAAAILAKKGHPLF